MSTPLSIGFLGSYLPLFRKPIEQQSLGGSESALLYLSQALARRGHQVDVVANCPDPGYYRGVHHYNHEQAQEIINQSYWDICIVSRSYPDMTLHSRSKQHWLWMHDMPSGEQELRGLGNALWQATQCVTVSPFHTKVYQKAIPSLASLFWTSSNGIDLKAIQKATKGVPKKKKRLIYAARPERGLYQLLKTILPAMREQDPEIELAICSYNIEALPIEDKMKAYYEQITKLIQETPGVDDYGPLSKMDYWKLLASSKLMAYPTHFPEVFCINAAEAMACGTPVLTTFDFALPQVVPYHDQMIPGNPTSADYVTRFTNVARSLMTDDVTYARLKKEGEQHVAERFQWDQVADAWETRATQIFQQRFEEKTPWIVDRLLYNSDLVAAQHLASTAVPQKLPLIETLLEKHAAIDEQPDLYSHEDAVENDWIQRKPNTRYQAVVAKLPDGPLGKIIDIGSGSGAMVALALDQRGDDIDAVECLDFSPQLVARAQAQFAKHPQGDKVSVQLRTLESDIRPTKKADVVLACEIMEHMVDTQQFLTWLDAMVQPGGLVILTVPAGPWEAMSLEDNIIAHVHHFEQADLFDIFGKQKNLTIQYHSVEGESFQGEVMGHHVISYQASAAPYGRVNYERKFTRTLPRETLAACLITKNGEDHIRLCLNSIKHVVDEIIIGDNGSTDATLDIVRDFQQKQFPPVHLFHEDPDPDGDGLANFATWRNNTIAKVHADWILWIDCDEELMNAENLRPYLNVHSPYNGYVIRQNQVQGLAPQPYNTEKPQRIFRAGRGTQFCGVVHEMPYDVPPNDPVDPSMEIPNVDILHYGYRTNQITLYKAMERNLPLIKKDRMLNPTRTVGEYMVQRDSLNIAQFNIELDRGKIRQETVDLLRAAVLIYLDTYVDHMDYNLGQLSFQVEQQALQLLGSLSIPVREDWGVPFEVSLDLVIGLGGLPKSLQDQKASSRWFAHVDELDTWITTKRTQIIGDITSSQGLVAAQAPPPVLPAKPPKQETSMMVGTPFTDSALLSLNRLQTQAQASGEGE